MTRYSRVLPGDESKQAKSCGSYLRVHFKNTRELGAHLAGMKVSKALAFMTDVTAHKQAVPFRRFAGGIGRTAQGKYLKAPRLTR